jgi:hypothetical protein
MLARVALRQQKPPATAASTTEEPARHLNWAEDEDESFELPSDWQDTARRESLPRDAPPPKQPAPPQAAPPVRAALVQPPDRSPRKQEGKETAAAFSRLSKGFLGGPAPSRANASPKKGSKLAAPAHTSPSKAAPARTTPALPAAPAKKEPSLLDRLDFRDTSFLKEDFPVEPVAAEEAPPPKPQSQTPHRKPPRPIHLQALGGVQSQPAAKPPGARANGREARPAEAVKPQTEKEPAKALEPMTVAVAVEPAKLPPTTPSVKATGSAASRWAH